MDEQKYMEALSQIVESYHQGEITGDEFHERMADLRDHEIKNWRWEAERPGGEHG